MILMTPYTPLLVATFSDEAALLSKLQQQKPLSISSEPIISPHTYVKGFLLPIGF